MTGGTVLSNRCGTPPTSETAATTNRDNDNKNTDARVIINKTMDYLNRKKKTQQMTPSFRSE